MKFPRAHLPPTPWGELPPILRLLLITPDDSTGVWLQEAFASDQAAAVTLVEAVGIAAGLTRLREESFDTVLIVHDPQTLDALAVLDAIRTGSNEAQPILVLGMLPDHEISAFCFEAGADGYVCLRTATTRAFLWQLARATERHKLLRENERLQRTRANCTHLEREEAERMIEQQRRIFAMQPVEWNGADPLADPAGWTPPAQWSQRYQELLRAYIIMGASGLAAEIEDWINLLIGAHWNPRQVMQLHLDAVETMVQELGCRSSRHVMNRANLLAMQLLMSLSELHGFLPPLAQ